MTGLTAVIANMYRALGLRQPQDSDQRRYGIKLTGRDRGVYWREFVARGQVKAEKKARRLALRYPDYVACGYAVEEVKHYSSLIIAMEQMAKWRAPSLIENLLFRDDPVMVFPRNPTNVSTEITIGLPKLVPFITPLPEHREVGDFKVLDDWMKARISESFNLGIPRWPSHPSKSRIC
jgi:hypothetical protein